MKNGRSNGEPTQRQLRVGEQVRHAISEVFMRGDGHISGLDESTITISEVRVSPDLKHASVYFSSFISGGAESVIDILNDYAPLIRKQVSHKLKHMKYTPKLYFKLDPSFDEAHKISELLNRPEVRKDIVSEDIVSKDIE